VDEDAYPMFAGRGSIPTSTRTKPVPARTVPVAPAVAPLAERTSRTPRPAVVASRSGAATQAAGLPPKPPRAVAPSRAADPDSPGPAPNKRKSRAATVFLVFGIIWLVAGLGMLGWVAWELWGTNIGVRDEYARQIDDLENMWADPATSETGEPADPDAGQVPVAEGEGTQTEGAPGEVTAPLIQYDLGQGFAILDIPRLGLRAPIMAGTSEAALARGVGWEEYTQLPGQYGNFVVAGHHSSRGHPFDNLQALQAGDEFTVETRDYIYTYRMLNSPAELTVEFTDTWVTLPDPIAKTNDMDHKYATLLTCKEFFSTPYRSIGFAELVSEVAK
jgi:sortase A